MKQSRNNMDPYINLENCSSHKKDFKYIRHNKTYSIAENLTNTFLENDDWTTRKNKKSQSVIVKPHLKSLEMMTKPVMKNSTIRMTDEHKFSKAKISNHRLKGKMNMFENILGKNDIFVIFVYLIITPYLISSIQVHIYQISKTTAS